MSTVAETKLAAMNAMANVHKFVGESTTVYFERFRRSVYVTPKSYLSFINSYKELYSRKLGEVRILAEKINTGLRKLLQAGEQVAGMKIELQEKEVSLAEAQKIAGALLVEIQASTAKAEKKKAEVLQVKNVLEEQAARIAQDKASCESDLAKAKPALEAAEAALSKISPKDIQGLKALKSPPRMVKVGRIPQTVRFGCSRLFRTTHAAVSAIHRQCDVVESSTSSPYCISRQRILVAAQSFTALAARISCSFAMRCR
jgi:dynein heavy chain